MTPEQQLEALQQIADQVPTPEQPQVLDSAGEFIKPPTPSGTYCKGYRFDMPNMYLGEFENDPDKVKLNGRPVRWCCWIGSQSDIHADGDSCSECGRVVQDKYLGMITARSGFILPTHAVNVWLEPWKKWILVEVAAEYPGDIS
jgi:hypothetical protein